VVRTAGRVFRLDERRLVSRILRYWRELGLRESFPSKRSRPKRLLDGSVSSSLWSYVIQIDEGVLNQTVHLAVGQVMELRLKENPTSGFRWNFATDGEPSCKVVGDLFESGESRLGAGGEHVWHIKAVRAGTCEMQLFYRRPFEPGAAPAQSFAFHVQVTE
jgi:predicted secreted protein